MSPELQNALQQLLVTLFGVALVVVNLILVRVAQFLAQKRDQVKTSIGSQQWALIQSGVVIAIQEAEQLGVTQGLTNKLSFALARVLLFAESFGIDISPAQAKSLIEAAIHQGKQTAGWNDLYGVVDTLLPQQSPPPAPTPSEQSAETPASAPTA